MRFHDIFQETYENDKDIFEKLSKFKSKHSRDNIIETLSEHLFLVKNNFLLINEKRELEQIYDKLIRNMFPDNESFNIIKKVIVEGVLYHDLGKINPYFQKSCVEERVDKKKSQHSIYSYYLLLLKNKELIDNFSNFRSYVIWTLFKVVSLHHMSLENFDNNDLFRDLKDMLNDEILKDIVKKHFPAIEIKINEPGKKNRFKRMIKENITDNLFFLIKLFYSHLVLSDFYGTLEFTQESTLRINQINKDLIENMNKAFFETKEYNKMFSEWKIKEVKDCSDLNECRMNLLVQASQMLIKKLGENKRVFMLNVPTGGGKTNIAIRLMLDILKYDSTISKAFWVFPYINIIEQNFKVIKETLNLNEDIIVKTYSSNLNNVKTESLIDETEIFLDTSFLNNPINVITNINFFDTIIKVKKNNRYKTSFFVNSVVVIDEIQSLPIENIDFFYQLIKALAQKYNMYFIIMSATLPDLNLFIKNKVPHLIPNFREYFSCKEFQRNKIVFDNKTKTIDELKNEIKNSLKEYNKILVVLNTISSSIKLFEELEETNPSINVLLLNSLTPIDEREKLIEFIKKSDEKIVLVSTQSIEAGVDLDFDCCFRDYAPLDSIEQVAGRVNRESRLNKRESSFVKVLILKEDNKFYYKMVYKNNKMRVQEKNYVPKKFNISILKEDILNKKLFHVYYEEIMQYISYLKKTEGVDNLEYINLKKLRFSELKNLSLIKKLPEINLFLERPINLDEDVKKIIKIASEFKFFNDLFINYDSNHIKPIMRNFKDFLKVLTNEGFLTKPYVHIISSFMQRFAISVPIYNKDNSPDEIVSYLEDAGITNNKVISDKISKEIIKSYKIKDYTFYYFDISLIKEYIQKTIEEKNESIII